MIKRCVDMILEEQLVVGSRYLTLHQYDDVCSGWLTTYIGDDRCLAVSLNTRVKLIPMILHHGVWRTKTSFQSACWREPQDVF